MCCLTVSIGGLVIEHDRSDSGRQLFVLGDSGTDFTKTRHSIAKMPVELSRNCPDVADLMAKSKYKDPVGMIIEMTDDIGKQLTYAALEKQGMPKHEIPELIASYCNNAIPTFKCVVSFETAKKILPITSETALQNLTAPRKPGVRWIVIVGGGGNSYAQVPVRTG